MYVRHGPVIHCFFYSIVMLIYCFTHAIICLSKKGISIIAKSTVMLDGATVFANNTADILPWPVSRLYTEVCLKKEDRAIDGEKALCRGVSTAQGFFGFMFFFAFPFACDDDQADCHFQAQGEGEGT